MSHAHALAGLPGTPGPLKNHLNKWEALFARILLTMHAVEFAPFGLMPAEILKVTAERVEKLMLDYLLPNAIRFYGEFYGRDKHVEHASWIAGYILAHRCCLLNSRDAYRARNEFREPRVLDRAMTYLEMAGWVVPMSKATENARLSGGSIREFISFLLTGPWRSELDGTRRCRTSRGRQRR
jgi:hypothetical protein